MLINKTLVTYHKITKDICHNLGAMRVWDATPRACFSPKYIQT